MTDQYNVVLVSQTGTDVWASVASYAQRVLPFDRGNPDQWTFSRESVPYVGSCIVLKTLNEETANLAHSAFGRLENVIALSPCVCEWEQSGSRAA